MFAGAERMIGVSAALTIADAIRAIFGAGLCIPRRPQSLASTHACQQESVCLPYLFALTATASF